MNLEDRIAFFEDTLFATTGITTFHYHSDFSLVSSNSPWKNHLHNFFFFNSSTVIEQLRQSRNHKPVYYTDSLYLSWIIQPFVDSFSLRYYVLGPVFETAIPKASFKKQMDLNLMTVSSQISFMKMTKDIPVISGMQFCQYATMLHYVLYQEKTSTGELFTNNSPDKNTKTEFSALDFSGFDILSSHGSQLFEIMLLNNVRQGNIQYEHPSSDVISSQSLSPGILCPGDPLRQAKDNIIVFITLVTRAAVEGGLAMEIAYSLSDYYIQNLELTETINAVYDLSNTMYDTFIQAVHQIRHIDPCSQSVQYIKNAIQKHIYDDIKLESLAVEAGYNTYYLSRLFKKETGISIKDYILTQKIEKAKIILKNTEVDINEISNSLSFHSPSYFSTVFKRIVGVTPTDYRKTPPLKAPFST
jgi:AraC-like DNA-binding protein